MNSLLSFTSLLAQGAPPAVMPPVEATMATNYEWGLVLGVAFVLLGVLLAVSYFTRTGVIARATTMEATRQPLFILLMVLGISLMLVLAFLPYLTFGEDIKMFKDGGLSTILISGILLAVWTASTSISQEIEGRTAMTLLSKPVNRRQFVVGKYLGILQAVLLLILPLAIAFCALIYYKVGYDAREQSKEIPEFFDLENMRPNMDRLLPVLQAIPPMFLVLCEIAVMAAVSVAISTRAPLVVNMTSSFAIFVIAHIAPVLVQQDSGGLEPVRFVANLIAIALPGLEFFNTQTAVSTDTIVAPIYLGTAALYCASYSAMAILLAFILFEDRDLT
jgi:ABC-type transport system involved in multi-copper enzyme maturation permease subunit